jgi:hypothetical protein
MLTTSRIAFIASSFVAFSVVSSLGCAHPQTVTLTSASAVAPAAPSAPAVAAAPAAATAGQAEEGTTDEDEETASSDVAPALKPAKKPGEPMTFEELSAALGSDDNTGKIALAMDHSTPPPSGKGFTADGYSSVGAAHQAVETGSRAHAAGDIKLSGGMTVSAVRAGVHESAGRLRACYEHGLVSDPRLAGRVMVSFSVDSHGAVTSVDTESDVIPADVTSCIRDAFSSMTFAPPKSAPAKIVYPIDFNKDS